MQVWRAPCPKQYGGYGHGTAARRSFGTAYEASDVAALLFGFCLVSSFSLIVCQSYAKAHRMFQLAGAGRSASLLRSTCADAMLVPEESLVLSLDISKKPKIFKLSYD